MAKKTFARGIDAILGDSNESTEEYTPKNKMGDDTYNENAKKEKKPGVRTTVILEHDVIETVKALAYWERKILKEIVSEAMIRYIDSKSQEEIEKALFHFRQKEKMAS